MTTFQIDRIEEPSAAAARLRPNALGVPSIAFFMMASVAVLAVVAGVIPTSFAVTGLTSAPVYFITVCLVLALYLVGYLAMAARVPNAGAFYSMARFGLGRAGAVAIALVALVAYNALQVGMYGLFGPVLAGYVKDQTGVDVPWWGYALAAWFVVFVLGLLDVKVSAYVLGALSLAEVVAAVVVSVDGAAHPSPEGYAWATLAPTQLLVPGIGAAGVVILLGFVGFEVGPVLAEEARNSRRTVKRASYLVLGVIALVYAFASFAMVSHYGASNVVGVAREQGPGTFFGQATGFLANIALPLFITSAFAALLAFHNIVGRYMYSLGRENVLPKALGQTGPKSGAPWVASLGQSLLSLFVVFGYALAHLDPLVKLFFWIGTFGGFGVLCLLAVTSVSVVCYFARNSAGESMWQRVVAPVAAGLALWTMLVFAVINYPTLMGLTPDDDTLVAKIFPAAFAVPVVVGLVWALVLRVRNPAVYDRIGLGPDAVAGTGPSPAAHARTAGAAR